VTLQSYQNKTYSEIRSKMQPGDIIAFGGNSLFSKWAKLTTRSPVTHVAVVVKTQILDEQQGRYFNQVIEATSYNGKSGVMVNRLSDRVSTYDGDMWWLPLGETQRQIFEANQNAFFNFLFQQEHKDYDIWQLFGSAVDATDTIPFLGKLSSNSEDFSSWFCSELVAEALEIGKIIKPVNASEVTPVDICRLNIYQTHYTQFCGEQKQIKGFNSLSSSLWAT
jgi:hypothetical protein